MRQADAAKERISAMNEKLKTTIAVGVTAGFIATSACGISSADAIGRAQSAIANRIGNNIGTGARTGENAPNGVGINAGEKLMVDILAGLEENSDIGNERESRLGMGRTAVSRLLSATGRKAAGERSKISGCIDAKRGELKSELAGVAQFPETERRMFFEILKRSKNYEIVAELSEAAERA
jgi:hypothetical protein